MLQAGNTITDMLVDGKEDRVDEGGAHDRDSEAAVHAAVENGEWFLPPVVLPRGVHQDISLDLELVSVGRRWETYDGFHGIQRKDERPAEDAAQPAGEGDSNAARLFVLGAEDLLERLSS